MYLSFLLNEGYLVHKKQKDVDNKGRMLELIVVSIDLIFFLKKIVTEQKLNISNMALEISY